MADPFVGDGPTFPQKELGRCVLLEMGKPVPNFTDLRGRRVAYDYIDLKRVCSLCNGEGHPRKDCVASICARCSEVGQADALCKRCAGDHAMSP